MKVVNLLGEGTLVPIAVKVADKEKLGKFLKIVKTSVKSFLDIRINVPNAVLSISLPKGHENHLYKFHPFPSFV